MSREAYRWLGIGFLIAAILVLSFKLFGNETEATAKKVVNVAETTTPSNEQADWKKKYEDLLAETETAKLENEQAAEAKASEKTEATAKKSSDNNKKQDSVSISIGKGEPASDVAKKLAEYDMISDADYFTEFMRNNGYEKFIRNGTYTIKNSMNLDDIAKTITGQN